MLRKTPTPADIETASAIIGRTSFGEKNQVSYEKGDWEPAWKLSKKYTGYEPSGPCNNCRLIVLDNLRYIAGLTYARKPLSAERIATRLAHCAECPAKHDNLLGPSCGRLILDALSSQPVVIDGEIVYPCGCYLKLKAAFKSEECPAGKWN